MTLHCDLTWAEEQEALKQFQNGLDADEEELLSAKFTQYVFFEPFGTRNFRECICTTCGRFEFYRNENPRFFEFHHRDEIECPNCGTPATLYALGKMRNGNSLEEWQRAAVIRPGKDGAALITAGYGVKRYSFGDLRPIVEWYPKVRTYLRPGKRGQWRTHFGTSPWSCFHEDGGWQRSGTVKEPFAPGMTTDGSYWLLFPERMEETSLKYCQLDQWYYDECREDLREMQVPVRSVHRYLAAYTAFPSMEMAVKLGFSSAATDLVMTGKKNARYLDWSADRPWKFLRMSKTDFNQFRAMDCAFHTLEAYGEARRNGAVKTLGEMMKLVSIAGGEENVGRLTACAKLANTDVKRAAAYLEKQNGNPWQVLQLWKDYLDMAVKLEFDLNEETVAMPKDLQERHDNACTMLKIQTNAEKRKLFQQLLKKRQQLYAFSLGGYSIVVPQDSQEIVREGNVLRHCVGGYAPRNAEGKVDILFLRRDKKPDTPFLTIEMKPRRSPLDRIQLVQIHGYRNELYKGGEQNGPNERFRWFLDAWFAWMKAGSKRDKNGKPMLAEEKKVSVG